MAIDKAKRKFNDKVHDEDSYIVNKGSVVVYQLMQSGVEMEMFLTKKAIEQLYKEMVAQDEKLLKEINKNYKR